MTLYTVYDNRTDMPIVTAETAERCAKVMGVKLNTFHRAVNPTRGKRWTILKHKRQLPDIDSKSLPTMVRVSQMAKTFGISTRFVCKICEEYGVPIVRAGQKRQLQMIPRDEFLTCVRRENESN